ncbi:TnsA endonuclease N-terminal domain-containing protein [Duganella sp. BJB476]|uniref:TnsA endonuclease N-terminal domain-containing protein n=1 Tax=Duganella sp. BJB476 TaxID=1871176 RepID=UPI000E3447C1|nr:TnsA endonuclease N-terminal domain-containing protein [Duganella sp. BJB476]RFP28737.1 transposase [Duganella sp. BJB476]
MRKKPLFTPRDLERFRERFRGTGIFEAFIAWHRVTRTDPSSRGRSHLQVWAGPSNEWKPRHYEFLSDGELVAFHLATMHPGILDIREQFPLALDSGTHELNAYRDRFVDSTFPGTIELAEKLHMKHPIVTHKGDSAPWVLSTDLLLTIRETGGELKLLAVSVRPAIPWKDERAKELLNLEREYWTARGVQWLLITPTLYDPLVARNLHMTSCWALAPKCDQQLLQWMVEEQHGLNGENLTSIHRRCREMGTNADAVNRALWQGIWSSNLLFDLRRTRWPSAPFVLLSSREYWDRNPIVSGRTSWKF